ncbi:MAG TPA: hypothetical protein VFP84_34720 [Kofleriaceae bacterium]|nr:hypothetical protein [Kofleriaceae bacterium]
MTDNADDKAVPEAKPEAKAEAKAEADAKAEPSKRGRGGDVRIELEMSRQRSIGWTIGGGVIGALLIWKLGTVGVWGGVLLVVIAAYHAWNLIQTFLYPPGTVVVTERDVSLPRGVCVPRPVTAARKDVTAVYFLRRSVPWNKAAPVLVIEVGDQAMLFPRDWFASEADQRHIVRALLRDKPAASVPTPAPAAASNEPAA